MVAIQYYLLSKRGKQMGVHDSAVWKEVDAFTRLNIRWRSTKDNVTNMSISVNITYYQSTGKSLEN